jgi:hypothetical protein
VQATLDPFATADVQQVCVRGTDAADNTSEPVCILLAVVDPSAGFVTGNASITSSSSACPRFCRGAVGRANISLVARYENRRRTPTGETNFQFKAGNLKFESTSYAWLVIKGASGLAELKGTGQINGASGYSFSLTAYDGRLAGIGSDRIHLTITDSNSVIYDNVAGISQTIGGPSSTQPISSGNIVIHLGK